MWVGLLCKKEGGLYSIVVIHSYHHQSITANQITSAAAVAVNIHTYLFHHQQVRSFVDLTFTYVILVFYLLFILET